MLERVFHLTKKNRNIVNALANTQANVVKQKLTFVKILIVLKEALALRMTVVIHVVIKQKFKFLYKNKILVINKHSFSLSV